MNRNDLEPLANLPPPEAATTHAKRWVSRLLKSAYLQFILLNLFGCVLFCLAIAKGLSVGEAVWDLARITDYLKVPLPSDAKDLTYSSGTNQNVHVQMSFKASPQSALNFANHFCGGILHQGYNPFDAINVIERISSGVKIEVVEAYYTGWYYSYSPRTPQTAFGAFCTLPQSGLYWVLVDQTDPSLYAVKFKHRMDRYTIPKDIKPVPEFPLIVRGMGYELKGYLADRQVCLDMDLNAVSGPDNKWRSLPGTDIQVLIDGKPMADAYISSDWRLLRKDGNSNYSDPDSDLFKYCLLIKQRGVHTITLQLPPSAGSKTTYSWSFNEEAGDSQGCPPGNPDRDCF